MFLSRTVDYVLNNLANDGRSLAGASRLRDLARQGNEFASLPAVLHKLEEPVQREERPPLPLRALPMVSPVLPFLLLPFYYTGTLLSFLPYWLMGLKARSALESEEPDGAWQEMLSHWGKYPQSFLIKALEAPYYWREPIVSPSLEVGAYRGHTSRVVFHQRHLDVGLEFVPQHVLHLLDQGSPVHRQLLSGDVYNLPFKDNTFNTVFFIHSFDDLQRGAEGAAAELARVLRPGGRLVFSSYSGHFGEHNLLVDYLRRRGCERPAQKIFRTIYLATDNIFPQQEWNNIMAKQGLTLECFEQFFSLGAARIMDLPFRLEGYLMNLFNFHDAFKPFMNGGLARFYRRWLLTVAAGVKECADGKKGQAVRGINFFAVARKNGACPESGPYDFWSSLRCPSCLQGGFSRPSQEATGLTSLSCTGCGRKFPLVFGLPVLQPMAAWTD